MTTIAKPRSKMYPDGCHPVLPPDGLNGFPWLFDSSLPVSPMVWGSPHRLIRNTFSPATEITLESPAIWPTAFHTWNGQNMRGLNMVFADMPAAAPAAEPAI